MSNVINMGGGGIDLVTGTLKSGSHVIYSDGDVSHDEIPTADKSAQVLGNSIVYAPFGLTGGATAMSQAGFWLVTDDFTALEASATASTTPKSGVTYTNGISDLTPDILSKFAAAISNNTEITYKTDTVYCDLSSYHKKITVGDTISIPMDDRIHDFRVVGFNVEQLTNPSAYGSVTYTGKAGIVFDMVDVYSTPYKLNSRSDYENTLHWKDMDISKTVLPSLKQKLPNSWKSCIKAVTHTVPVLTKTYVSGGAYTEDASGDDYSEELFLPGLFDFVTYGAIYGNGYGLTATGSFIPNGVGGKHTNYNYWNNKYTGFDSFAKKNGLDFVTYWLRTYFNRYVDSTNLTQIRSGYMYTPGIYAVADTAFITKSNYVSFCFCL